MSDDKIVKELNERKSSKSNKWVHTGVIAAILVGLAVWAGFSWKLTDESLDKTCRVVNVAAESATFGYLSAKKADLVPEKVKEVIDTIGDALLEVSAQIEQQNIDLTNAKVEVTDTVNKFIDEKLEGNVLYKTFAGMLLDAGFNSAQTYLNTTAETKASDYVAIIASMRAGILVGAAPFHTIESTEPPPAIEE